jgi:AcrR family transcriptional regulator
MITDISVEPRRARREKTRAALLDAAERLWAERGIHGASLDDISSAAGLTKGAVYSNFTGKTDLVLALLDRYAHGDLGLRRCDQPPGDEHECGPARLPALLFVEFWLFGMRDYAAGWRIAEWYTARRDTLAAIMGDEDAAAQTIALDLGMAMLHLLDPRCGPTGSGESQESVRR